MRDVLIVDVYPTERGVTSCQNENWLAATVCLEKIRTIMHRKARSIYATSTPPQHQGFS
jgi:hypothetical protein